MVIRTGVSLRERFRMLAEKWREECKWSSSLNELAMHPAYQQIIGLGPDAIPILLEEMQRKPDHWSWALRAISGENAVKDEHRGDVELMANDWIEWGKQQGYLP